MRRTLYTHTLVRASLTQVARTDGTVNGTTVDLGVFKNNFRTVLFVVHTATITDGTHTFSVETSPNNSDWTAAGAERIQGTLPAVVSADDNALFSFGFIPGNERYVRAVVTTAGSTTGGVFGAVALLSQAGSAPVARS